MEVEIYSRGAIEELLQTKYYSYDTTELTGQPEEVVERDFLSNLMRDSYGLNVAVISFYDPPSKNGFFIPPIDYRGKIDRVFQIALHDIDIEVLGDFDLTVDTYFTEVDKLAEFVYSAKYDGFKIICQCEYGQSRSAGCAAAIREHFNGDGIKVFADYRYYPNQLIFNKVLDALERYNRSSP